MAELRTPQGHTLLLPEGCVSIGADPANEVPVAAHLGLAPVHFRLQPWEGGHFLEDAGSGLGTLVNGHPVNWKPLSPGDVIVAGELEVVYSQETKASSGPVPALAAPAPPAGLMAAFPLPPPPPPPPLPAIAPVSASPPIPRAPDRPHHAPDGPAPLAALSQVLSATPPAWLPEDLLPEGYRIAVPSSPKALGAGTPPSTKPSRPGRRHSGRRALGWAALLALLAWGGHKVWQKSHVETIFGSLREPAQHAPVPAASPSLAAPAWSAHPVTPKEAPAPAPAPAGIPRIATQPGR